MNRPLLLAAVSVGFTSLASAQSPPAAAALSKAQLASVVKVREQRAALLLDDLKASDTRIEARIDAIVSGLTRIQDSRDSGSQVARIKAETMQALVKNVQTFQARRAALVEEMRRPTLRITLDQKKKVIAIFDGRIEKRVAQILALQKSFPTYAESDRFTVVGSDWGPSFVENEAWKQNRRLSQQTDAQREKVIAGLKKSIARLETQKNSLVARKASSKLPLEVQFLDEEIARVDGLMAERQKQLIDVSEGTTGGERMVSQREATSLSKTLQTAQADLQRDVNALFSTYSQWLVAVSDLDAARAAASQK